MTAAPAAADQLLRPHRSDDGGSSRQHSAGTVPESTTRCRLTLQQMVGFVQKRILIGVVAVTGSRYLRDFVRWSAGSPMGGSEARNVARCRLFGAERSGHRISTPKQGLREQKGCADARWQARHKQPCARPLAVTHSDHRSQHLQQRIRPKRIEHVVMILLLLLTLKSVVVVVSVILLIPQVDVVVVVVPSLLMSSNQVYLNSECDKQQCAVCGVWA